MVVLTDVPRSGVREEALAGTLQTLYSKTGIEDHDCSWYYAAN